MVVWCSHLVPIGRQRAGAWPASGRGSSWSALDLPVSRRMRGCGSCPILSYEGQSKNDVDDDAPTETAQLRAVLEMLTGHYARLMTATSALWDGWGSDIEGGGGARILDPQTAIVRRGPQIAPAFPSPVLRGPKVVVPNPRVLPVPGVSVRLRRLGAAEEWPGQPRLPMPDPRVHLASRPRLVRRQRRRPALGRDRSRRLGHRTASG
jgi:hypothetical protein